MGILIDNGKIYEFTEGKAMQLRFEIPEAFWESVSFCEQRDIH